MRRQTICGERRKGQPARCQALNHPSGIASMTSGRLRAAAQGRLLARVMTPEFVRLNEGMVARNRTVSDK